MPACLWSSEPAPALGLPVHEPQNAGLARVVWGVDALVLAVADALAARFAACTVRGELSGWSRASSGHCYFNLKDADGGSAMLRCAMFRRAAGLLDFTPADGHKVELRGRLGVYEARGELQLVVESMQRAGAGSLYEEFLRRKLRLTAEGLFDASRKRRVPTFPTCIGVVTSLGAAALHDVLTTMARRAPHVKVVIYPSLVQGTEAPAALCAAIASAARHRAADTLIVCRGGGSLEDLMAFNDERVVRAIAAAPMPVICGVGHESYLTLADLVADLRAATPTAASELAAPRTQDCLDLLDTLAGSLRRRTRVALDGRAQGLDRVALRLARPADNLRRNTQRLDALGHRLALAVRNRIESQERHVVQSAGRLMRAATQVRVGQQQALSTWALRLHALDPNQVLARGYAWLADAQGRPVTSVSRLAVGANLSAVLTDGHADVAVTGVFPAAPSHEPPRTAGEG
jgi:exodeoxyribonuclease VII large subunit